LFNSGTIPVVGALPPFSEIRSVAPAQGRFYNDEDNENARNVAFLGSDVKKQLFADREAMGQTVWLNGVPYTVIGVMKAKDQNSSYDGFDTRKIFIPFNSMRRDFPNKPPAVEHTVDRLLVAPWSLETHKDCDKQLRRTLARLHNFDPRDEEAASIWDTVKNAQANRMIIVGMEIFMGAVGTPHARPAGDPGEQERGYRRLKFGTRFAPTKFQTHPSLRNFRLCYTDGFCSRRLSIRGTLPQSVRKWTCRTSIRRAAIPARRRFSPTCRTGGLTRRLPRTHQKNCLKRGMMFVTHLRIFSRTPT